MPRHCNELELRVVDTHGESKRQEQEEAQPQPQPPAHQHTNHTMNHGIWNHHSNTHNSRSNNTIFSHFGCSSWVSLWSSMMEAQTEWKYSVNNSRRRTRRAQDPPNSACDRNQRSRYAESVLQHLRAGETALAESLLDEAITQGRMGCSTKAFYHFLIHQSAEKGCVYSALWFALRMIQRGLHANIVTVNSMINACAQAKKLNLAMEWWALTEKLGVRPNAITYNTMIKACAQACKPTCAEEWLVRMADDGSVRASFPSAPSSMHLPKLGSSQRPRCGSDECSSSVCILIESSTTRCFRRVSEAAIRICCGKTFSA